MKNLVYLNGQFVPGADARVSIFDRGFLYGDGVFETMRAYEGRIFRLDDHMERLQRSAESIGLTLPGGPQRCADICRQLLARNEVSDALLRMSVTRGQAGGGIGVNRASEPTVVAHLRPPMPLPDSARHTGVSAKIVSVRRVPSTALNPHMKSMNFLNQIMARAEAEAAGAFDSIMLNQAGHIAETSTANIFFARDGMLFSPAPNCDILLGITRAAILELAAKNGIRCEERPIEPDEINSFEECFLTSTGIELLPVTRIDDAIVGDGMPGPLYQQLHSAYRELVTA
ncbi:MAG: branched-chain-amino-acid transaminase [Candidatus Abyssubacteria bacterium]